MDFSVIFQTRTKKFWWMDVIFYFAVSSLVATIFCWLIFLFKDGMVRKQIADQDTSMQAVGTGSQKQHEMEVINYKKKINDFSGLLYNHEFASNVFAFMQAQTMPNIWFSQFDLDEKNNSVQLSGEADSVDAFSRQVSVLEANKYVKNIGTVNSSLGQSARTEFNIGLALNQNIFDYLPDMSLVSTTTPSTPLVALASPTNQAGPIVPQTPIITNPVTNKLPNGQVATSQKLITSFHLLLNPEVVGAVDETNFVVTLNVPYGIDVKNLTPSIVSSPGTTVSPATLVSQDFTNPVTYTVVASDGSTQAYKVKVIVSPPPEPVKKDNTLPIILTVVAAVIVIIILILAVVILLIRRKNMRKA